MTLSDIKAAVASLLARSDSAFKADVESVKATVDTALSDATAKLSEATTENQKLTASVKELTDKNTTLGTELASALSSLSEFNAKLTDACLAGKLLVIPEGKDAKEHAATVSLADKFAAYQGALNAAFSKANLPAENLLSQPGNNAAPGEKTILKLSQFRTLRADQQSAFCALVRSGNAQLIDG